MIWILLIQSVIVIADGEQYGAVVEYISTC